MAKKKPASRVTAKPAPKATAKPKPAPKALAKAKPAPKPAPKPAAKPAAKPTPAAKPLAKGPAVKPGLTARPDPKGTKPAPAKPAPPAKTNAVKPTPAKPDAKGSKPTAAPPAATATANGKVARKGITIVTPKPVKKAKPKASSVDISSFAGNLLGMGLKRKPLISSGPAAPAQRPLGAHGEAEAPEPKVTAKSPFDAKELERFRLLLERKRAELLGDISGLEEEALRGESGSLSNMPQHMAEQGSETYEQSLNLDLAAADRKLLKEIDDAITRINNGVFGVCELTGRAISKARLEELPWARYSIEAARELERRSMRA